MKDYNDYIIEREISVDAAWKVGAVKAINIITKMLAEYYAEHGEYPKGWTKKEHE